VVLYGHIRPDGTLSELKVLRGVDPRNDQAALEAFRRWHFAPASRSGAPVPVEILVGIPAKLP